MPFSRNAVTPFSTAGRKRSTRWPAPGRGRAAPRRPAVLHGQLAEMAALVEAATGCAAAQPAAIRDRLQTMLANIADLAPGMPEERVGQEMALLIARLGGTE